MQRRTVTASRAWHSFLIYQALLIGPRLIHKRCRQFYSMRLYTLLLLGLFFSCQSKQRTPYFDEVSMNQLSDNLDTADGDFVDTIIRTQNYEFYYVANMHHWEGDHYYYLKKGDRLFRLEPVDEIDNGFKRFQVLNDSTLIFYTQFYDRPFGDFWIIKTGKDTDLRLDSGRISNTERYNLKYREGKLIAVGNNEVNLDSVSYKQLRNTLYRLENGKLLAVSKFENLKVDIDSLDDGTYYFSHPGRHISDTLTLTN